MEYIQLTLFGKTFPEHSVQTKGRISGEFSKKSQKPKFQYLKVRNGQKADWLNYQTVQSLGELSMPSIGAFPNIAVESTLSQILEVNAPQKYYLSPKACQGILRREEKRGKELPPLLKAALMAQAKDKFLVTNGTDFESAGFISRASAEAYSIGYEEEMSATLRAGLIPDVLQGICHSIGFCPNNSSTAAGLSEVDEKSPTLSTTKNVATCYPINTQVVTRYNKLGEGTGMGIGDDGDPAYTLQAAHSHGVIYAIDRVAFNQGENAKYDFQIENDGVNSTIVARGPSAVCYNSSGNGVAGTLDAHYYLGCGARGGKEREFDVSPNNFQNLSVWIVRRLTPRECESLQGFPDDWTKCDTDGNELKDTPRYKALGNSIAIPCALRVFQGIVETMAKEKR